MKTKKLLLVFAVVLALNLSARADYTIEETIEHSDTPTQKVVMKIKPGKARCDIGAAMSTISSGGEMTMLMHEQKAAMKTSFRAMAAKNKQLESAAAMPLKPTGRKEKINGFETEEYVHENPALKSTTHYWIAKNYADGAELMKLMSELHGPAAKQLVAGAGELSPETLPGLPVRTEIESNLTDKPTKTKVTIMSINKGPVDDAAFVVPADYRQTGHPGIPKPD